MALQTFAPPVGPSPGTGRKREIKLLAAEFGEGYTQSGPDGINYMRFVVSLAWNALTEAQMLEIDLFFEEHGGHTPFYYKPAGFAAPLKWDCKDWDTKLDEGVWVLTAELKQSFDPRV